MAKSQKTEATVEIDRRDEQDRRQAKDRRTKNEDVAVERRASERRVKVPRRRQIDPTTCERDYTNDELEFMSALDDYKRSSGRMFPTCSEILEVVRALGYQKPPACETESDSDTEPTISAAPIEAIQSVSELPGSPDPAEAETNETPETA